MQDGVFQKILRWLFTLLGCRAFLAVFVGRLYWMRRTMYELMQSTQSPWFLLGVPFVLWRQHR